MSDFTRREAFEPIYKSVILFLVGGDCEAAQEEAKIWFKEKGVEPLEDARAESAAGLTLRGTERHFVLWRENLTDRGTMVHELVHVGTALFEDVGIPITRANDEALAHYLDWLAEQCPAHLPVVAA